MRTPSPDTVVVWGKLNWVCWRENKNEQFCCALIGASLEIGVNILSKIELSRSESVGGLCIGPKTVNLVQNNTILSPVVQKNLQLDI